MTLLVHNVQSSCPPFCGTAPIIQLPLPWPTGSVNAFGNLPTNPNNGDVYVVMTPAPPHAWFWNGLTWVDGGPR